VNLIVSKMGYALEPGDVVYFEEDGFLNASEVVSRGDDGTITFKDLAGEPFTHSVGDADIVLVRA